MHKICNTLLLQYECSEQQAVCGNVDRYIDAVSGMYKGRYMAGYSQDLGVTGPHRTGLHNPRYHDHVKQ